MSEQASLGLFARQTDIFNPSNPEHQKQIIVVGAGTIGSWFVFGLAKLGIQRMSVFDADTVELQNCSNQMYVPNTMLGKLKTTSLGSILKGFGLVQADSNFRLYSVNFPPVETENFVPETGSILVSCVDKMSVRKEMFEYAKKNPSISFFVDGRMGGQVCKVFGINMSKPEDVASYEATLYSDDSSVIENEELRRASEVPCTAQSIVDVSMITAGKMIGNVRKFITGQPVSKEFVFDAKNDLIFV